MKAFTTLFIILFSTTLLEAQSGNTKSVPSKGVVCKTLKDSASYSLGYNIGQNLAKQYAEMDINMITEAIKDAYTNKKSVVDVNAAQVTVQAFVTKEKEKKMTANKAAGAKFLKENMKKPGVQITASGLQYEVIKMSSGEKPKATDLVEVNYAGRLINGTEFDNSSKHKEPSRFSVGGVISGWTEALQLMPVGSKFKLYIPSNLAYGDSDMGKDIPAGSTLIFDLELLKIVK